MFVLNERLRVVLSFQARWLVVFFFLRNLNRVLECMYTRGESSPPHPPYGILSLSLCLSSVENERIISISLSTFLSSSPLSQRAKKRRDQESRLIYSTAADLLRWLIMERYDFRKEEEKPSREQEASSLQVYFLLLAVLALSACLFFRQEKSPGCK